MIKNNRSTMILTSLVILLPILIGLLLWNQLPSELVTHWDAKGTPNGWSPKWFAVIGLPLILLALHWLCATITSADPKSRYLNRKMVTLVLWICPIVSLFCAIMVYAEALNIHLNVELFGSVFTGAVFIMIGNYLPKCQQNYTVGIKLPWTLNSKENWNRTHRFAGPVWVICGVILILAMFMRSEMMFVTVVLAAVLIPTLYSYLYYRKYEK